MIDLLIVMEFVDYEGFEIYVVLVVMFGSDMCYIYIGYVCYLGVNFVLFGYVVLFYVDGEESFVSFDEVICEVVYIGKSIIDGMYFDLLVLLFVMYGF